MCTLIVGLGVVEPGSVILAANRDEDPARPSAPPGVLLDHPPVAGGRDLRSGGTWLAVRERRAAVALLNRRDRRAPDAAARAAFRSRGLLALEVAATDDAPRGAPGDPPKGDASADGPGGAAPAAALRGLDRAALAHAARVLAADAYGACSLLWASPDAVWVARWDPPAPASFEVTGPGWHVITHADLDDRGEPRTARLLDGLAGWVPAGLDAAVTGLWARLRVHGDGNHAPAVCVHEGGMPTVSSSIVWLARSGSRYLHVQGRPCEGAPADCSHLLAGVAPAPEVP